jgi:hypothetical protein
MIEWVFAHLVSNGDHHSKSDFLESTVLRIVALSILPIGCCTFCSPLRADEIESRAVFETEIEAPIADVWNALAHAA